MRNKIIAVNAVIVLIIGLLSFVILRAAVTAAASNTGQLTERAKHDAQGAAARFQLDGLRVERWLATKAAETATLDAIGKASPNARGEAATALCDQIGSAAKGSPSFEGIVPSLVVLVDDKGKIVGRNGSALARGDDLGALYPPLKEALAKNHTGSDVWVNRERNDQYLASFAPVVEGGVVKGAIVIGTTLNDELSRVSDATTGRPLFLFVPGAKEPSMAAHSTNAAESLSKTVEETAKGAITGAITTGHSVVVPAGEILVAAAPLEGFADGKRGAIVAAAPSSLIDDAASIPYPIIGVTGLGILLVVVGGWLLGNYISRPVNMLEEGLLAILNGQTDKRFELDHAELGGLAFRIDQLLNQLMGIEEDTTDDEGRVSKAPTAANFTDAMAVDEKRAAGQPLDTVSVQVLAAEPSDAYYKRIYGEYIAAKRALGEGTDHITEQAFATRIQGMEAEATARHGKPVRYQVQASGREVVLLAIPLA